MTTDSKLIIAAKRIAAEMEGSLRLGKSETCRGLFMAFGISLLIIFESYTGVKGNNMKPDELLKWAHGLPNPTTKEERTIEVRH